MVMENGWLDRAEATGEQCNARNVGSSRLPAAGRRAESVSRAAFRRFCRI
jgi:hypothetical protein